MHARLESSASDEVSVRSLAGLGPSFLPTVRRLPAVAVASCLFLTSYPFWYPDSQRNTGTKHSGLNLSKDAPHKLTPMLGVHDPELPTGGRNLKSTSLAATG